MRHWPRRRPGLICAAALSTTLPLTPRTIAAQERTVGAATERLLDSLFAPFARSGAPGASVLVVRDGVPIVRRAYGLADVVRGVRATPATNYRLASLSKQFTAMSILQLAERGGLGLDQPIRLHLPELPPYADAVTVRHLLTHASGLPDYEDFVPDTQTTQLSDADVLRLVSTRASRLLFPAGSEWRYSNTGYALLALIVERVSGASFADALHRGIFAPLGMRATVAHVDGRDVIAHRAFGHTVDTSVTRRTDQSATSAVLGDGGIYSSIDDLAKWDAALTRGSLVSAALWSRAITPHTLSTGASTTYGFGWFVESHLGRRRLRHHGETRGFTNAISRYPADGLTIVVLTNRTSSAPWEIVDRLAEHLLR